MISLVINTCAGGAKAAETLSSGGQPHAQRAFALRNFILPAAIADPTFNEVIVVGEWEPGNGYTYIEVPSKHFSCVDALQQRQVGFEKSRGDVVIFQHDDHILEVWPLDHGYNAVEVFEEEEPSVLVPARYTRLRNVNGERLYNGEPDLVFDDKGVYAVEFLQRQVRGYISGHCAIYRREVLEKCPWGDVSEKFTWDVQHTAQIRAAGFKITWSSALKVWDVEAGSRPW